MHITLMDIIASVLVLVCLPLVCTFALQVFAAGPGVFAVGADTSETSDRAGSASVTVLVPAHNEALVIGKTLESIQLEMRADDRILVVADNCNDETADIAKRLGVEVIERTDTTRLGKGFALAYGVDHLRKGASPWVVIVIDADCCVSPGAISMLCRRVCDRNRPLQALYLMNAAPNTGTRQNASLFAWRVKNWLRPRGGYRLGWPCLLTGSGMAFPWALLEAADLAHGGIVEDMQLGLDLAMNGAAPEFCELALVTSTLAASRSAAVVQRARWEHGHLGMILTRAPALALSALRARDMKRWQLLLELTVPPLSLLALCVGTLAATTSVLAALGRGSAPLAVAACLSLLVLCVALHRAWRCCGTDLIAVRDLPTLLTYAAAKIPRYVVMLFQRRQLWIKTKRDS